MLKKVCMCERSHLHTIAWSDVFQNLLTQPAWNSTSRIGSRYNGMICCRCLGRQFPQILLTAYHIVERGLSDILKKCHIAFHFSGLHYFSGVQAKHGNSGHSVPPCQVGRVCNFKKNRTTFSKYLRFKLKFVKHSYYLGLLRKSKQDNYKMICNV